MITNKRKKYGAAVILCLTLILVFSISVNAIPLGTVVTVKEGAAGENRIYVAGNPDNYPIEYYNTKTDSFEGIMPQILARVAEETGLNFAYLNGGKGDLRERMARNKQCEMISCIKNSEDALINAVASGSDSIFAVKGENYFFGYTSLADAEQVALIEAALAQITTEDILDYSINTSGKVNIFTGLTPILISSVAIIAILVLSLFIIKSVRKSREEAIRKAVPKLLTAEEFHAKFDENVTEDTHSAYSIVCLGIDAGNIAKNYGNTVVERQLKYCESLLLKLLEKSDIAFRENNNIIIAGIHGGRENVEAWVRNLLAEINGGESVADRMGFHAGVCMLASSKFDKAKAMTDAKQAFYESLNDNKMVLFCTPELMRKITEKNQLAEQAAQGIQNGEFKLYLQLTVKAEDQSIVGAEALTRWEHPTMGLLHPAKFITAMTQNGLVRDLDLYTFESVCKVLESWQKRGIYKYISCNFTRNTIDNEDFVRALLSKANQYTFNRFLLVMEITEESIAANQSQALENIKFCKEAGFSIALDDVGSGSTSFSDLCEYPIDMMKIDRSILLNAESSDRGKTLLTGMVSLARSMNMATLCEGVETEEQLNFIKQTGCEFVQGFHFYHPMPYSVVDSVLMDGVLPRG